MAKTTKNTAKKRGTDIPLDNIPDRTPRQTYTPEFKTKIVERIKAGEEVEAMAREIGTSPSVIWGWRKKVDAGEPFKLHGGARTPKNTPHPDNAAAMLRHALAGAMKARNERLEAAASIVEADVSGSEADQIAKKIRTFKRDI